MAAPSRPYTLAAVLGALLSMPTSARADWEGRKLLVQGKLAAAYVEPTLYRRPDAPRAFFMAIWIRNTSKVPIAVDDGAAVGGIHPNQWGATDETARTTVDERTRVPVRIDAALRSALHARMSTGALPVLEPGSSLQAYVPFDGNGWQDVDRATGKNLIISFDGEVLVTDGNLVESIGAKALGLTGADLVLRRPIAWRDLPPPPRK